MEGVRIWELKDWLVAGAPHVPACRPAWLAPSGTAEGRLHHAPRAPWNQEPPAALLGPQRRAGQALPRPTCPPWTQEAPAALLWPAASGGPGATRLAWYLRWKLFARAGRMGYNIMNVDGDFIFFRSARGAVGRPGVREAFQGALGCAGAQRGRAQRAHSTCTRAGGQTFVLHLCLAPCAAAGTRTRSSSPRPCPTSRWGYG